MNGHSFAGGFVLALSCDYRVMSDAKKKNAWCCMNEASIFACLQLSCGLYCLKIHFGAPWPTSLAAVVRTKVPDSRTVRRIALEGHRFTPQEALEAGFIDRIADGSSSEDVLSAARQLAEQKSLNAKTGVWGLIKVCNSSQNNSSFLTLPAEGDL